MKNSRSAALVFSVGLITASPLLAQEHGRPPAAGEAPFHTPELSFIENRGQWPAEVLYALGSGPYTSWVERSGFVVQALAGPAPDGGTRQACALEFRLKGARKAHPVTGEQPRRALRHYLQGADSEHWVRQVRAFGQVRFEGAWPGIDLCLREMRAGAQALEYDLHLEPGADLDLVQIEILGGQSYSIRDGRLMIETAIGQMSHSAPVSWSETPAGERTRVQIDFRVIDEHTFGFSNPAGALDAKLVVDPGIHWSTYLGDLDLDLTEAIVRANNGDVLVAGSTLSPEFPRTRGAYDFTWNGLADAFVSRLGGEHGELIFSTFLGGSDDDGAKGLGILPGGELWLAGDTRSADFPVLPNGFDRTYNGGWDGFVVRLGPKGEALLAQTFLGTAGNDRITDLATSPGGLAVVCGSTNAANFPTLAGSYDTVYGGGNSGGGDAFVTGLQTNLLGLRFSTFLGGSDNDGAKSLAIGRLGNITVGGWTASTNFPVTAGAVDGALTGTGFPLDGFVCRLTPSGSALAWSTYFGGSARDKVLGVAAGTSGDALVVGETQSTDLLISSHCEQPLPGGLRDGFFTRLSATGALKSSTYFGGSDMDQATAVCELSDGTVAVVGSSVSTDFPVNAWVFDRYFNSQASSGESDVVFTRYDRDGQRLYGSYLGGAHAEEPTDVAFDGESGILMCGQTNSYNFPTPGGFDPFYDFSLLPDGFVTRVDFARHPFTIGVPKVNSTGSWMTLGFGGFPSVSEPGFQIWANGSAGQTFGLYLWSDNPGTTPFAGSTLYMGGPFHRGEIHTLGWLGGAEFDVPMDASLVGTRRFYQFWYSDPGDPSGVGLSEGLEVLFYP